MYLSVIRATRAAAPDRSRAPGFLITLSGQTLNTARVMVGIVIIAALGVALGEVLRRIEHRFDVWRREAAA